MTCAGAFPFIVMLGLRNICNDQAEVKIKSEVKRASDLLLAGRILRCVLLQLCHCVLELRQSRGNLREHVDHAAQIQLAHFAHKTRLVLGRFDINVCICQVRF